MRGTSHLATGLALGATVAALTLPLPLVVPFALTTGAAALLPDLDTPNSLVSKALPPVSVIVRHIPFNKHRMLTHWLLLWIPLSVAAVAATEHYAFAQVFVVAFFFGYLVHLLEDSLTLEGVPLLRPWKRWHLVPWVHFRSGGFFEKPIVAVMLLACVVAVTNHYIPQAHTFYTSLVARR